jgi:hypothetical protein
VRKCCQMIEQGLETVVMAHLVWSGSPMIIQVVSQLCILVKPDKRAFSISTSATTAFT